MTQFVRDDAAEQKFRAVCPEGSVGEYLLAALDASRADADQLRAERDAARTKATGGTVSIALREAEIKNLERQLGEVQEQRDRIQQQLEENAREAERFRSAGAGAVKVGISALEQISNLEQQLAAQTARAEKAEAAFRDMSMPDLEVARQATDIAAKYEQLQHANAALRAVVEEIVKRRIQQLRDVANGRNGGSMIPGRPGVTLVTICTALETELAAALRETPGTEKPTGGDSYLDAFYEAHSKRFENLGQMADSKEAVRLRTLLRAERERIAERLEGFVTLYFGIPAELPSILLRLVRELRQEKC
jgi:hypothetical protein